jgi:hypothetical protein
MNMDVFSVLMVIAFGSMTGTGFGLIIGFLSGWQGGASSKMTRHDRFLNGAVITGCSVISIVGLGWIFLA